MNRRSWEKSIWAASVVVLILAARQIRANSAADDTAARIVHRGPRSSMSSSLLEMFDADFLDSAAVLTAAHDPFRISRKQATIAFSVAPTGVLGPPVPLPPSVRIALQGTIGGPPWRAVIAGIPGHEGTVIVSSGDTLGGIAIRQVSKNGVTVRVKDSTWTVTMIKP